MIQNEKNSPVMYFVRVVTAAWKSKNRLYFNLVVNDPFLRYMIRTSNQEDAKKMLESMENLLQGLKEEKIDGPK